MDEQKQREEEEVQRILGMTEEELLEWIRITGRDPRKMVDEFDETALRAKRNAEIEMKRRGWR